MIIIERFEGNLAILEDNNKSIEIERASLPKNAKEGDLIELKGGKYVINAEKTAERRRSVISRLKKMGL